MAEEKEDPKLAPIKSVYDDLGFADRQVDFPKFLDMYKSNPEFRKSVYKDTGIEKEGVSFDSFEETTGIPRSYPSPSGSSKQDVSFAGAKTQEQFLPDGRAESIQKQVKEQKAPKPLQVPGFKGKRVDQMITPEAKQRIEKEVLTQPKSVIGIDAASSLDPSYELKKKVAAMYREDPTQFALRVRAQQTADDAKYWDQVNSVGLGESIANSAQNAWSTMKKALPQTVVFSVDTYENLLGKEATEWLYKNTGAGNPFERRAAAYQEMADLDSKMKAVKGNIADNLKHANAAGLIANLADAVGNIAATAIPALATRGASTFTTMGGQSLADYNNAAAEAAGKTTKEFYDSGKASFAIPMALGSIGAGLELVGLHSLENLATKKLTGTMAKKLATFGIGSQSEGLTELFQGGIDAANKNLGSGGDKNTAWDAAWDHMLSKDGFNEYAMGVFASGGAAGLGAMARKITKPSHRSTAESAVSELADIQGDLNSTTIAESARQAISNLARNKVTELTEAIDKDATEIQSLPKEARSQVEDLSDQREALQTVLDDESISDTSKKFSQEAISEIDKKIDQISDDAQKATVKPAEDSSTESVPVENKNIGKEITSTNDVSIGDQVQFLDGKIREVIGVRDGKIIFEGLSTTPGIMEMRVTPEASSVVSEESTQPGSESTAGDVLRGFANTLREGKISKLGGFKVGTGFDGAWDIGLELTAKALEGGAKVVDAIADGLSAIRKTEWYQQLKNKDEFDRKYEEHMQDQFNEFRKTPSVEAKVDVKDAAKLKQAEQNEISQIEKDKVTSINKQKIKDIRENAADKELNLKAIHEDEISEIKDVNNIERKSEQISAREDKRSAMEDLKKVFTKKLSEVKQDALDKANSIKDLNDEFRGNIKNQIRDAVKSGILQGNVRSFKVRKLLGAVNNAKTVSALMKASDYVSNVINDIDHDKKVDSAKTTMSRIKSLAKRKNLPANIADAMKKLSQVRVNDVDDINKFNTQLNLVVDSFKGESTSGLNISEITKIVDKVNAMTEQKQADRYAAILISEGVPVPADATAKSIKSLIDSLADPDIESKDSQRDVQEAIYTAIKEDLNLIDESLLSKRKKESLIALKEVDVSKLDDSMVAQLLLNTKNAIENNDFSGTVRIVNAFRLHNSLSNQNLNDRAKKATRPVSEFGSKFRSKWATVTAQLDAISKDRYLLPHMTNVTGFDNLRDSFSRYKGRIQNEVETPLGKLIDKYAKDLDDKNNQILLSMYADLNNTRSTWTEQQVEDNFSGRKKAIQKSIEEMEERSSKDKGFAKANKEYIANLKTAFESIKDLSSPAEILPMLNDGSKALYSQARTFFDSNKSDLMENAEIDNNLIFESDWENYFPRKYDRMNGSSERDMTDLQSIEDAAGSTMFSTRVTTKEQSGSQKGRSLFGENMPDGKAINFDFIGTYLNSAKSALYDIETQANRQYASFALGSDRLYEVFSDKSGVDVMKNGMVHLVNNQRNFVVGGAQETTVNKMLSAYQTLAVRTALGGVAQVFKQWSSAAVESSINLGKNFYLMGTAAKVLTTNSVEANALMDKFSIGRRSKEQRFANTIDIKGKDLSNFKKRIKNSLFASGIKAADNVIDVIALGALKKGDDLGAKMSWLAYYMDYQKRQDPKSEFNAVSENANPDQAAAAYAEHMTSLTLNINDSQLKSKGGITTILAPFASFNINAKINLMSNLKRLGDLKNHSSAEAKQLIKLVSGNLGSMFAMNGIGFGIRSMMIAGASNLVLAMITSSGDIPDKDKDKAELMISKVREEQLISNRNNSWEYLAKDLIYGGIAGAITDPIYDQAKNTLFEMMDIEKTKKMKAAEGIESSLGLFSIPIRTAMKIAKNYGNWTQTDEEFRTERYGIEDAFGEKIIVPEDAEDVTRPSATKTLYGLATMASIVQMTGLSSQEVSAIMSRSTSLAGKLDNELTSKKNKATLNDLKLLKSIVISGKKIELTDEQYEYRITKRREYLDKYYSKFESSYKNALKGRFDRADFEAKLKTMANGYANNMIAIKYKDLRKATVMMDQWNEDKEEE